MDAKLEIYVYDLKMYVEKLLQFLIFNHFRFDSFGDVAYLLDRGHNINNLNTKVRLINFAQKINKQRMYKITTIRNSTEHFFISPLRSNYDNNLSRSMNTKSQ